MARLRPELLGAYDGVFDETFFDDGPLDEDGAPDNQLAAQRSHHFDDSHQQEPPQHRHGFDACGVIAECFHTTTTGAPQ